MKQPIANAFIIIQYQFKLSSFVHSFSLCLSVCQTDDCLLVSLFDVYMLTTTLKITTIHYKNLVSVEENQMNLQTVGRSVGRLRTCLCDDDLLMKKIVEKKEEKHKKAGKCFGIEHDYMA